MSERNIVARVRAAAKEMTTLGQAFDMLHVAEEIERRDFVIQQMYAELERLREHVAAFRAAGDQLHAWVTVNSTSGQQNHADFDKVLNAWEEACRG